MPELNINSLTLPSEEVVAGRRFRVAEQATGPGGTSEWVWSDWSSSTADMAPTFTSAPAATGTPSVGETLTVTAAVTGSPKPVLTYQWFRSSTSLTVNSSGSLPELVFVNDTLAGQAEDVEGASLQGYEWEETIDPVVHSTGSLPDDVVVGDTLTGTAENVTQAELVGYEWEDVS